jgi:uncharacterized protein YodC (DUF2158 family)
MSPCKMTEIPKITKTPKMTKTSKMTNPHKQCRWFEKIGITWDDDGKNAFNIGHYVLPV